LVGSSSIVNTALLGAAFLQVNGDGNERSQLAISRFSADSDKPRLSFLKSRGASVGTNSIVSNGDVLGELNFLGADGSGATGYPIGASIYANVDGTPGTNDMPGRLVFSTTADGTATPIERMRITNAGFVGINQASPGSALDVKGTLRLSGSTSGYVGLAPAAAAGSVTYTLPSTDGTTGQFLSTNGSGTLSWASASGGASTGRLINVQVFTTSGTNTYTRSTGVVSALVIAVGGGGGGKGASGGSAGGNGGNGTSTSFGSHVTAAGGTGATSSNGGAGGTGGSTPTIAIAGQGGGAGLGIRVGSNVNSFGGSGGGQGGGAGVRNNSAGNAGVRGGGGSGGADTDGTPCVEGAYGGGGGGQGETCIKYIAAVGSSEIVTVGLSGTGGTGTRAGGAGGVGYVIVYEYS
jgi:hypothetical protein